MTKKKKVVKKKQRQDFETLYVEIKSYCILNPCWGDFDNEIKDPKDIRWIADSKIWKLKEQSDLFQLLERWPATMIVQEIRAKLQSGVYLVYKYILVKEKGKIVLKRYVEKCIPDKNPMCSTINIKEWDLPSKNEIISELLSRYYGLKVELKDYKEAEDKGCHPFYINRFNPSK